MSTEPNQPLSSNRAVTIQYRPPPACPVILGVSSSLRATDAHELRAHYRSGGFDVFRASTMGAALERAAHFAYGADPCRRCGGDTKSLRAGSGFVSTESEQRAKRLRRAMPSDRTRAALEHLGLGADLLARVDSEMPALGDRVCPDCHGFGVVARTRGRQPGGAVTARPIGTEARQGGVSLDEAALARLGRVSRQLTAIATLWPEWVDVLAAYYGPDGGRLSLYEFTGAGKKLLRKNPQKLPPVQLIKNEAAAERENPDPTRRALLDGAEAQARDLLHDAARAWNFVSARRIDARGTIRDRARRLLGGGGL